MTIKLSDYLAKELVRYGVKHIFMISGGGAMHLNDSLGQHPELEYICNHHEQASAIAAEGYARVKQQLVVVNVTTGPGGINALNGVFGQWTDSVPVLYISGQVKYETTLSACANPHLRQLGDQEVDIINIVKPITKYAQMVKNPNDIKKILHEAIHAATTGRPGPAWIDIPVDVQGAMIKESELGDVKKIADVQYDDLTLPIQTTIELLKQAQRPVIVAGHGIRISGTQDIFHQLIDAVQIPTVTTLNSFDLMVSAHPLYMGRIGSIGQRAGNFVLQNADFVLFLGTRNNIRQVSYNWKSFARNAKKVVVDIDPAELNKPTLSIDVPICADLKTFLPQFKKSLLSTNLNTDKWVSWCAERKYKYNPCRNEAYRISQGKINPYDFILSLTTYAPKDSIILSGNGTASVALFQAGIIQNNQRMILNSGNASMGYALPAAIGACFASDKKDVICLTGDGSIMMNLQELQTIKHYNLPIKIFVLNNNGYSSIRQTQKNFFNQKLVACSDNSGVSMPNFSMVAHAFGLSTERIEQNDCIKTKINTILQAQESVVCEVMLDHDYIFQPKLSSEKQPDGSIISKPLEDMYPFLERQEFNENMI